MTNSTPASRTMKSWQTLWSGYDQLKSLPAFLFCRFSKNDKARLEGLPSRQGPAPGCGL